jgi:DNA-binding PadR family transcriptional regulator
MHPRSFRYSKPSPSYLYSTLKKMECEGLISKNKEDKYELTEKGKISLNKLHEFFQTEKREKDDAFTIENALTELESYIDYLEDTGKEKLKVHLESIENLIARLKNIKESLDNN